MQLIHNFRAVSSVYQHFGFSFAVRATIMKTEKSYASIGKDGAVKCVAVGIPRPKFSWTWGDPGVYEQKLSAEEGPAGRFQVKTDHYFGNSTSYLMIKNVQTDDLRNYECTLKNGDMDQKRTIPLVGYCKYFFDNLETVFCKKYLFCKAFAANLQSASANRETN